jgi:hypothetical protein
MRELSKWRIESKPRRGVFLRYHFPFYCYIFYLFLNFLAAHRGRRPASQPAETMGMKKERGRQAVGASLHPLERSAAAAALYICNAINVD